MILIFLINSNIIFDSNFGDWGIGDWGLGPIPNPQSPIPNPQSPVIYKFNINKINLYSLSFNYYLSKIIKNII